MERNEKGQFLKGQTPEGAVPISEGNAKEMQARSAGTRLEYLVAKAISNHAKGALSLKDLTYLQKLLGEDVLNIKTDGPQVVVVSDKSIRAAEKWSKKDE